MLSYFTIINSTTGNSATSTTYTAKLLKDITTPTPSSAMSCSAMAQLNLLIKTPWDITIPSLTLHSHISWSWTSRPPAQLCFLWT